VPVCSRQLRQGKNVNSLLFFSKFELDFLALQKLTVMDIKVHYESVLDNTVDNEHINSISFTVRLQLVKGHIFLMAFTIFGSVQLINIKIKLFV